MDGLEFIFSHESCKILIPGFLYHGDAGFPVGAEDQCKDFRKEIIEFLTLHDIRKLGTIHTTGIPVFDIAATDLAPGSFCIVMTSRAGIRPVLFA